MSDVTDQYLLRARSRVENQYESLRRALGVTLQRQGWQVEQIIFIAGDRSLNEQDLRKKVFPSPGGEHRVHRFEIRHENIR